MTQYVINIGAVANDGTGDPLRTAFNEVNLNFDQVFAAGPVLSNIQIANNTILTTNTNGNLVLAPNGVGVVQANVNIVPNTANIRNLGAANRRWSTLYIQYANISGAITVADLTATGNVTVGGNLSVTGNVINIGNIVTDAKTIQLANTAGTANAASGSGITVGANDAIATMLYSSATNAWTFNIGVDTPNIVVNNISSDDSTFVTIQDGLDVQGDITAETVSVTGNVTANYFIGNGSQLTGVSNYANANAVAYGQAGWAGNIVPAASNTYSLGNSTNWWSNVWVAGNTMYIGGVPIGMGAGNTLTVDGNSVVTVSSNTTANLANIGIDNNNIFNNQGQGVVISNFSFIDEAETAYVQIPAGNSTANLNIVQKQGNVRIAANAAAWLFDDTGNLILPTNGSIVVDGGDGVIGPVSDDFVISWDNEEIRLVSVQGSIEMQADNAFRVQTNYDGGNDLYAGRWEFSNNELVNISNNFGIVSEAGNLTLSGGRDGVNSGNTTIRAVNVGVAVSTWTFDNTGNLTLPSEGNIVGVTPNNAGRIQWLGNSSGDGAGYTTLGLIPDDTLTGNDQYLIIDPTAPGHIHIRAGGDQDNSSAELIMGGEYSHFKVGSGANATVYVNANAHIWWYNQDGTVQLPPSDYGYAQFYTGGGANLYLGSSSYPINIVGTDGTVLIPGNVTANGNVTGDVGFFNDVIVNNAGTNALLYTNSNREIYDTAFAYDSGNDLISGSGAISTTGNISAGYLFGNASQLTGLPAGYANSDVASFMAAFGSNSISTTGNVTANNISGNILVTGNVTGTTPNVTLIAGSYSWTFDNTGVASFPAVGGDEGGEINFAIPTANTTLTGPVKVDVYRDQLRFFDGSTNGAYLDLANCPSSVSTAIGYRDIPQISFTGNTTIVANAAGRHYYSTQSTDYVLTIANNTSVGWSVGTAITIVNRGTGNMTIAQGTGVSLYLAGNSTAGNRTVTTYGMATLLNVAANVWMINGTGVS